MDWLLIVITIVTKCNFITSSMECGNVVALAMVTEQQCKSSLAYVRPHVKSVTCVDPQGKVYVMRDDDLKQEDGRR